MNKSFKISMIVLSSLVVAGGISLLLVKRKRKKKEQQIIIQQELDNIKDLEKIRDDLDSQGNEKNPTPSNYIKPTRNLDKGITNNFSDIKGKYLIPAIKSSDPIKGHIYAQGFANIRETPEVNNSQGFSDLWQTNLLGKVSAGARIGTIISEQYDNMTPKMRWFKVKLAKKIDGEQYGWVRSDNVTFYGFKKNKSSSFDGNFENKSSSFDGNFVEKYDNSYMLGSDVFPHPNWMIGYSQYSDDVMSNFEGLNLDLNVSSNSNYLSSNFFTENRPLNEILEELVDKDFVGVKNVFLDLKIRTTLKNISNIQSLKQRLTTRTYDIYKLKRPFFPKRHKKFIQEIDKLLLKNNIKKTI